jgi:hypothetical protein
MDGIMQGEFLQTDPVEQEFVIYWQTRSLLGGMA